MKTVNQHIKDNIMYYTSNGFKTVVLSIEY